MGLYASIVNVSPAPHIKYMTSRENRTDMRQRAAAIARWDDDGGAFRSQLSNMGARVSSDRGAKLIAESPEYLNIDQASRNDRKILECLGAAVIMQWGTLPTRIQRELFGHAASLADLGQTVPPKARIARFLHNHKDDGDQTPRRVVL